MFSNKYFVIVIGFYNMTFPPILWLWHLQVSFMRQSFHLVGGNITAAWIGLRGQYLRGQWTKRKMVYWMTYSHVPCILTSPPRSDLFENSFIYAHFRNWIMTEWSWTKRCTCLFTHFTLPTENIIYSLYSLHVDGMYFTESEIIYLFSIKL